MRVHQYEVFMTLNGYFLIKIHVENCRNDEIIPWKLRSIFCPCNAVILLLVNPQLFNKVGLIISYYNITK